MTHPPLMRMRPNVTECVDPPVVSQPPTHSKNGKLLRSLSLLEQQGRLSAANVIKIVPSPTRYTVAQMLSTALYSEGPLGGSRYK